MTSAVLYDVQRWVDTGFVTETVGHLPKQEITFFMNQTDGSSEIHAHFGDLAWAVSNPRPIKVSRALVADLTRLAKLDAENKALREKIRDEATSLLQ